MIKELTPEETGRWMDAAPPVVQDAAASQETIEAVQRIGRAHSLHVDLVGILANLTRYMLIGYVTPPEALQELQSAGVAEQEARQILNELNQSVFMPLHDRIRQGGAMPAGSRAQTLPLPPPRYGSPAPPAPRMYGPPTSPVGPQAPPPPQATDGHGTQGTAPPLPPRHVLPSPGMPIFHRPMPPSPAQPMAPTNLPTGIPPAPPAPRPAPAESFYEFPPLARPVPPPISSVPDGATPHTRYPSDPYREPAE
ncbi:MAG: hypothetical protein Q7S95_00655 [bacterium]|nr:hypothetical protein [bacterium]